MKKIKKISSLLIIGIIVISCGNRKNTTTNSKYAEDVSNTTIDSTTGYDYNRDNNSVGYTNEFDAQYDRERMDSLYSHLNFDDEQKEKYEKTILQNKETWERDNPNMELNAQNQLKLEDNTMKSILNDDQYSRYQQWINDHPYNNQN